MILSKTNLVRGIISTLLICTINLASAQELVDELVLNIKFENSTIESNKQYFAKNLNDSISFSSIRFYISNIEFFNDEDLVYEADQTAYLIDLDLDISKRLKVNTTKKFNRIKFNIGLDSITNVSGALGGDLDPTKGMYWTWQSGYINFKLEGITKKCPARKNIFQFHLGGYIQPYYSMQEVSLDINDPKNLQVDVQIEKFLSEINLLENYQVMSPNNTSQKLSETLPEIFKIAK